MVLLTSPMIHDNRGFVKGKLGVYLKMKIHGNMHFTFE